MSDKIENGAGAPSRRNLSQEGPSPRFRHLAHLPSFCDNPIVFFTACTFQRRKILASPKCEEILREIWQRSAEHDGWWVGRYVLMPDHVHFFARPAAGARPKAEWVGMWKSVSSRQIAAMLAVEPPIWQRDYFDRYLRSSESYSEKWQYVEQNPVRASLVQCPEDWRYRGTINNLMFQPVKSLVDNSMDSACPRAVYSVGQPMRDTHKSGPTAGRLHVKGYFKMYRFR